MIQNGYKIKQYTISPMAGMKLIAKALIQIPEVLDALENRTIVIISGRTNRYVAELVAMVGLNDSECAYRIAVTGLEQQIMKMDEAYKMLT
ncbi:MAG TPA: hypothetical protein VJZ06_00975 [Mobilitalea sp.]|nr:hypothetical protein [Mobilitalea sp.]